MGVMFTIFTVSIIIALIGEGIVLFGDRKKHKIGMGMLMLGTLGFFYSFFNLIK
jgi:hypothetical protein